MKFSITLLKDFVLETRLEVNYIWFLFMKGGGVWVGGCGVGGDEAESEEEVDALQSDHDGMIRVFEYPGSGILAWALLLVDY